MHPNANTCSIITNITPVSALLMRRVARFSIGSSSLPVEVSLDQTLNPKLLP